LNITQVNIHIHLISNTLLIRGFMQSYLEIISRFFHPIPLAVYSIHNWGVALNVHKTLLNEWFRAYNYFHSMQVHADAPAIITLANQVNLKLLFIVWTSHKLTFIYTSFQIHYWSEALCNRILIIIICISKQLRLCTRITFFFTSIIHTQSSKSDECVHRRS